MMTCVYALQLNYFHYTQLAMPAVASRPRLLETEPKWFVLETSCYPFGGRIRRFANVNVNKVSICFTYSSCMLFLSMYTFIVLIIRVSA